MKVFRKKKNIDIEKRISEMVSDMDLPDSGEEYSTVDDGNGNIIKMDEKNIGPMLKDAFTNDLNTPRNERIVYCSGCSEYKDMDEVIQVSDFGGTCYFDCKSCGNRMYLVW